MLLLVQMKTSLAFIINIHLVNKGKLVFNFIGTLNGTINLFLKTLSLRNAYLMLQVSKIADPR